MAASAAMTTLSEHLRVPPTIPVQATTVPLDRSRLLVMACATIVHVTTCGSMSLVMSVSARGGAKCRRNRSIHGSTSQAGKLVDRQRFRRPALVASPTQFFTSRCPERQRSNDKGEGRFLLRDELVPAAVGATSVRALFISDVHLGTEGCQAELLLDFLRHYDANQIYLVGDIVDGWRLKAKWYWPQSHDEILQCLSDKVLAGARLFYIPGNHDEFLRRAVGLPLDGIEVLNHVIHEGIDGRRYLVVHGDQFDLVVTHARWLALLGDATYNAALVVNSHLNRMHRSLGLTWLSVATWAKLKITDLVVYISRFDKVLAAEARRHNVHGIICGHFHNATINESSGVKYINTGDWVESCTAVVSQERCRKPDQMSTRVS